MNDRATLPVTLLAPATMRLERLLPGPVERVWAYLTESEKRAAWPSSRRAARKCC